MSARPPRTAPGRRGDFCPAEGEKLVTTPPVQRGVAAVRRRSPARARRGARPAYDGPVLTSALFAGDALLEAIASDAGGERISRTRNRDDPAVLKVQTALLIWDAACLPLHGANGSYGDETADAVRRLEIEVIGVDPATVFDDVGPQTVLRLDAVVAEHEAPGGSPPVDPHVRGLLVAILSDSASPTVAALAAELARRDVVMTPAQIAAAMAQLLAP